MLGCPPAVSATDRTCAWLRC